MSGDDRIGTDTQSPERAAAGEACGPHGRIIGPVQPMPSRAEHGSAAHDVGAALSALRDEQLRQARRCGALALAAVAVFLVAGAGAQWWRVDLDWRAAPLSLYLLGDYGLVVKAGYFALAIGLVMLGLGARLVFAQRRPAAPLLFACAGIALAGTALFDTDLARSRSVTGTVHGLAAQASFLCVSLAMLAQSWSLRYFAGWRGRFALAMTLAVLAASALLLHAFWRELPRGITQKGVILLVLAWLALFANWLRTMRSQPVPR